MNQQLTPQQIADLAVPIPLKPPMTRHQRLMRLAKVVREYPQHLFIFHGLEYQSPAQLKGAFHPQSAFSVALNDNVLREAGLKADMPATSSGDQVSVAEAQRFFELSQRELHEFSCDCGGAISNTDMAKRIERLAGPPA